MDKQRRTAVRRSFVMKDNVAGKLRRYTSKILHEHNVVLAGHVGSVVTFLFLWPFTVFRLPTPDSRLVLVTPLLITHYLLLFLTLDSRLLTADRRLSFPAIFASLREAKLVTLSSGYVTLSARSRFVE